VHTLIQDRLDESPSSLERPSGSSTVRRPRRLDQDYGQPAGAGEQDLLAASFEALRGLLRNDDPAF
jgi:hypothetical protein